MAAEAEASWDEVRFWLEIDPENVRPPDAQPPRELSEAALRSLMFGGSQSQATPAWRPVILMAEAPAGKQLRVASYLGDHSDHQWKAKNAEGKVVSDMIPRISVSRAASDPNNPDHWTVITAEPTKVAQPNLSMWDSKRDEITHIGYGDRADWIHLGGSGTKSAAKTG